MVIDSDKRALTQIIINLVNNAIKFTDAKLGQGDPQPASRRSAAGHRVCRHRHRRLSIRAEDQSKLFQAFSQLDSTSTRHAEGAKPGPVPVPEPGQPPGRQAVLPQRIWRWQHLHPRPARKALILSSKKNARVPCGTGRQSNLRRSIGGDSFNILPNMLRCNTVEIP
ncbi:hypothetical protein LP419_27110 [Massilia sp. H-1]|nr:hypothetical protein LP419_27110 [Massilia sp. H-1]